MDGGHTFPLTETATHQLDVVKEQIKHQPFRIKARDYVRANPWAAIAAAAVIGLLFGVAARSSR